MRWGYTVKTGKLADQWVYLPELNMVRRISQRDTNNMDWGFTDKDLCIRDLEEDEHRLNAIVLQEGEDFYEVESIPRTEPASAKPPTGKIACLGKWITMTKTASSSSSN